MYNTTGRRRISRGVESVKERRKEKEKEKKKRKGEGGENESVTYIAWLFPRLRREVAPR